MPELNNRFKFEPNDDARKAWLATRKKPIIYSLPGFYNTIDYEKDTAWVILAVCIEGAAVALTLYGGITKHGVYLVSSIIAVALFVFFDWVGANWFHKNVGAKCLIRNKIVLQKDRGVQEGLREELKKGVIFQVAGVTLIVLSALFKITAILLLGTFNMIFYLIMSLLYLIVIYIHIAHTGYFLAEFNTAKKFRKQHSQWSEDKVKADEKTIPEENIRHSVRVPSPKSVFDSEIKLKIDNNKMKVGEHSISFIEEIEVNNQKIYTYEIETNGILKDEDIVLFTGGQTDQQGSIIALECLKHQIFKIH